MKIHTICYTLFCIIIIYSLIILPKNLFSQDTSGKEFKINTGAVLNFSPAGRSQPFAIYLAPSFKNKRHEFYAGAQMTVHSYFETFEPLIGGIGGYKFYIFKEPARVNMFAHYSLQYLHRSNDLYGGTFRSKWNYYLNTFGIGFNVLFDKKGRFSFYSTLGYCISRERYKIQNYKSTTYNAEQINISAGFSYRFAVLKKK